VLITSPEGYNNRNSFSPRRLCPSSPIRCYEPLGGVLTLTESGTDFRQRWVWGGATKLKVHVRSYFNVYFTKLISKTLSHDV